jgi:Putative amidoligase enzyme
MSSEFSNPHDRSFGVEIECGIPGGYDTACELFGVGYDEWYEDPDEGLKNWSIGEDGTEVEIRTPILYGEAGFKTLREAMTKIKGAGGYVTPYDGMHVHHGAPEFVDNPALCSLLVKSWKNNEEAIHSMVAPRRRESGACPKWSFEALSLMERWLQGATALPGMPREMHFYRNDLNLIPLPTYGTVEIRLHEGTLDPDVAISWIKFFQVFMHEVLQGTEALTPAVDPEILLSAIKLAPEAQEALERKRRSSYLTPETSFRPRPAWWDNDGDW